MMAILKKVFNNEKGVALVSVLVVSTVLALVGGSYLATSTHEAGVLTEDIQESQALYAAEAGLQYARRQLSMESNWVDSPSWDGSIPDGLGGTVTIAFNYSDVDSDGEVSSSDIGTITATSTYEGNTKTLIARVQPQVAGNPFSNATCGCNGIDFNGNQPDIIGDVASNGYVRLGGAEVTGNVVAVGDLYGDNGANVSGSATIGGTNVDGLSEGVGNNVVGGILENQDVDPPCDCNALNVAAEVDEAELSNENSVIYSICPSCMPAGTSVDDPGTEFVLGGSTNVTLPGGSYYFTKFTISGSATITIPEGEQVLIFLEHGGSNDFSFGGTGVVQDGSNDQADNFRIYSSSTQDIELSGTSDFVGAIYAPNASVNMNGTTALTGAVIGDVALMSGNVTFTYDDSLEDAEEPDEIDSHVTITPQLWKMQLN